MANKAKTQPADSDDAIHKDNEGRIITEEAKQQQVSHWDMDYLPREEIDRAMEEGDEHDTDEKQTPK